MQGDIVAERCDDVKAARSGLESRLRPDFEAMTA
jgi:hypothetical protein